MRGRLCFLGGFAVGYVIGSRAGRERYDQLVRAARSMWDHPTTQEAAGVVQEQAHRLYSRGRDSVGDRLSHTRLGEMMGHPEQERPTPDDLPRTDRGPHGPTF